MIDPIRVLGITSQEGLDRIYVDDGLAAGVEGN